MNAASLPERIPMQADSKFDLRRLRESDLPVLVSYRSDPRVARYQLWDIGWGPEDARQLFETDLELQRPTPGEWLMLIVEERASNAVCGDVRVHFAADQPDTVEIRTTLSPLYQGRGAATESLTGLLGWLFDELEVHRVFARADARNHPVRRLLDRLGFRHEATFIDADWFKGEWATQCIYAMLRHEWRLTPRNWPGRSRMTPGRGGPPA